jgi:hypothetical protein
LRDASGLAVAVRSFLKFTSERVLADGIDPLAVRLESAAADLPGLLDEWERAMKAQYPGTSQQPYWNITRLLLLIQHRADNGRPVTDRLRARADGPALFTRPPAQPLDEFSNKERLSLQAAARAGVRTMHRRLEHGRELAGRGSDPDAAGWTEPANLLWALDRGVLTVDGMREHLPLRMTDWPGSLLSLIPAGMQQTRVNVLRGLCHLLYPSSSDLQAFRVLLLLSMTACTPEELHDLRLDDIEFTDGGVRLTQVKHRAHRARGVRYSHDQTARYPGAGRWDVPGLIRQVLDVTSATRHLPGAPPTLFLTVVPGPEDTPPAPCTPAFSSKGSTFSAWITAQHDDAGRPLDISLPHDVRRLRKTAKTAAVAALGGTIADLAGDDHSTEVFRGHYAHGTTAHVLSGKAINRAQDRVFRQLTSGPLYVPSPAAGTPEWPADAQAAGLPASVTAGIITGDQDMGLTNCRDPYNSQFAPAGKLCHVAPAMCMLCSNAVVFPAQLPRIVMLADHIEKMRTVLSPPRWAATWGSQAQAIAELFIEAGEVAVHAARQSAKDDQASLDLPLGMRTEYDR